MPYDNWFPTAELRFVKKEDRGLILQQKWRRDETDDGEWRNVPLVTEE